MPGRAGLARLEDVLADDGVPVEAHLQVVALLRVGAAAQAGRVVRRQHVGQGQRADRLEVLADEVRHRATCR